MKKNNIVLIAGGAVSALLVLGSAAFMAVALGRSSAAREDRDAAFAKLRRIYQGAVFPSAANIVRAGENYAAATNWVVGIAEALSAGTNDWAAGLEPALATSGDFSQLREQTIEALRADAPIAEDGAPTADPESAFGFEFYSDSHPAQSQHVPRLLRQVRLVDLLVRQLYDSGILHLDAVSRDVFERGSGGASASSSSSSGSSSSSRGRRRPGAGRALSVPLVVTPPPPPPGAVTYDVERFGFRFSAKEHALLAFLDRVDALSPYAAVSGLTIEKLGPDAVFPDERAEAAKEGARSSRAASAEEEPAAPGILTRPPPRSSRMVSGPLREAPVMATVFVDVYFVGAAPSDAGNETQGRY